jgi:hypothetical protein
LKTKDIIPELIGVSIFSIIKFCSFDIFLSVSISISCCAKGALSVKFNNSLFKLLQIKLLSCIPKLSKKSAEYILNSIDF